jgi:hypothetical protein
MSTNAHDAPKTSAFINYIEPPITRLAGINPYPDATDRRWQQDGDLTGAHGRPAEQMQPLESNPSEMRRCFERISTAICPPRIDVPFPMNPRPFYSPREGSLQVDYRRIKCVVLSS